MRKLSLTLAVLALLVWAAPALAVDDWYGPDGQSAGGASSQPAVAPAGALTGGSAWEASFVQDIDLSAFMQRLYDVLTREDMGGQCPDARAVGEMLKSLGMLNIAVDHTEYQITGDQIRLASWTQFDDPDQATLMGRLVALPDAEIKSARYVADEAVLYLALGNVTDKAMLALDSMLKLAAEAEANGGTGPFAGMFGEDSDVSPAQALAMIKALKLDQLLDATLTGEVALAIYGLPEPAKLMAGQIQPSDIDAAVFIGVAGDESLAELLSAFGSQIGLSEVPSEVPGWRCLKLAEPEGIGVLANGEFLIATTDVARMAQRVARLDAGSESQALAGQMYLDLNIQRLHDELLQPLLQAVAPAGDPDLELASKAMAYLLDLPDSSALGHLRIITRHGGNGIAWELILPKAVPQYVMYYAGAYAPQMH